MIEAAEALDRLSAAIFEAIADERMPLAWWRHSAEIED